MCAAVLPLKYLVNNIYVQCHFKLPDHIAAGYVQGTPEWVLHLKDS